ncbi:MAG: hypothetical protein CM1200mP26_10460 [Acidimicrobiales bacterium]|nr:MAG: hypothetical protein CM1200mP26_10460 [Acidimicrobiales bacterium]
MAPATCWATVEVDVPADPTEDERAAVEALAETMDRSRAHEDPPPDRIEEETL